MFQSADFRKNVSMMLSEILDDIGINERMVFRRRRVCMLSESLDTFTRQSIEGDVNTYVLGSWSEGTSTQGLQSDTDRLFFIHDYNVIQDWTEWEFGKANYFMIQDENTTPGYCFLQLLQRFNPLPVTFVPTEHHINDMNGRILYRNTIFADNIKYGTRSGPSIALKGQSGNNDTDKVLALPCKSWPRSAASNFLERQGIGKWPTQKMRRHAVGTGCCVVATGSKVSNNHELEWRISTSLAERCLMFDLNITQIKCFVLMKIILKSLLNPVGKINISSYMCKTVLLHCIENREPELWEENNLLECLKECLIELHSCVQTDNLPHFIIPENNLLAGQFTAETKRQLLKNISDFIYNDETRLFRIEIDNFGQKLIYKFISWIRSYPYKPVPYSIVPGRLDVCGNISAAYYTSFSNCISANLNKIHNNDIGVVKQTLERLMTYKIEKTRITKERSKRQNCQSCINNNDNKYAAFTFLVPSLCTTYGSALASKSIGSKLQPSAEAFEWLRKGFDSDVSSGRLKGASVFYSTGDMEKTEIILRQTQRKYKSDLVSPICTCWYDHPQSTHTAEFERICNKQNLNFFRHITAFCVRFIRQEINCVPHELQYEMFRSTQDNIKHRDEKEDFWMDWAVVDSLPFLFFLQYKVYRHLQRYQDQQQALSKLESIIKTDKNLGHKETALNLLGQCMEQENKYKHALKCYLLSLQQRERDNVARIHICRLLFGGQADM